MSRYDWISSYTSQVKIYKFSVQIEINKISLCVMCALMKTIKKVWNKT